MVFDENYRYGNCLNVAGNRSCVEYIVNAEFGSLVDVLIKVDIARQGTRAVIMEKNFNFLAGW